MEVRVRYIAKDKKGFDNEADCLKYEATLGEEVFLVYWARYSGGLVGVFSTKEIVNEYIETNTARIHAERIANGVKDDESSAIYRLSRVFLDAEIGV